MKTKTDIRKLLIMNLPCVIFGFLMSNIGEAWRLTAGVKESRRFLAFIEMIPEAFANPLPGFCAEDILFGIAAAVIMRLIIVVKGSNQKKYRHGREYGSARWDAYYLLKEVFYGRRRRKHYDPIQQDHRAVLPPFSR